jgi:hypothetical protein
MATKGLKELLDDISMGDLTATGEPRRKMIAKLRDRLTDLTEASKIVVTFLHTLEAAEGEPLTKIEAAAAETTARRGVVFNQPRQKHVYPKEPTGPLKLFEGSLPEVIYRILSEAGRPITWDELRDGLKKYPTMTKVENDKSYYSGVQRLKDKGYCVSHKGRISTPENLKRFLDEVAAGRAVDVEVARHRNKWAEAILDYLNSLPNKTSTFRDIRTHLANHPEFSAKLAGPKPMQTYMANTLTQMVTKFGLLEKPMKGYYRIKGSNVDNSRVGQPDIFETSEAKTPEVRH